MCMDDLTYRLESIDYQPIDVMYIVGILAFSRVVFANDQRFPWQL